MVVNLEKHISEGEVDEAREALRSLIGDEILVIPQGDILAGKIKPTLPGLEENVGLVSSLGSGGVIQTVSIAA